jgi:beta-lactamase regulating signal transducer with metallopeptidase domain
MASAFLDSTFTWLLGVSWRAAVLAGLVLLFQRLLASRLSPAWRYGLWLLVLARLLLPVAPGSPWSIFNLGRVALAWKVKAEGGSLAQADPSFGRSLSKVEPKITYRDDAFSFDDAIFSVENSAQPVPEKKATPIRQRFIQALPDLWLLGVLALWMRLGWQNVRFALALRRSAPAQVDGLNHTLVNAMRQMRVSRKVLICQTSLIRSPALYGLFRPRLLLPPNISKTLTLDELRFVLLHELAHVKRWDMAVNWLTSFLRSLHWFNPVLWWAFRRISADRELAADALALSRAADGEKKAYGETLIKILAGFSEPTAMPGMVGLLEDKRDIARRIRFIGGFQKTPSRPAMALALFAVLCLTAFTDAQTEKPLKPEPANQPVAQKKQDDQASEDPARSYSKLVQDGRMLIEMGKFDEAKEKLLAATRLEPDGRDAYYFLSILDQMLYGPRNGHSLSMEAHAPPGYTNGPVFPLRASPQQLTNSPLEQTKLVQDGRMLIELGKLDEAETKLREAVKRNPEDRNALYYLGLIDEARFDQQAKKRQTSGKDALGKTEPAQIHNPQRGMLYQQLDKIRLEEVFYGGLPLSEVVRDLNEQARKRDPEKRGINIIIDSTNPTVTTEPAPIDSTPPTGQPQRASPPPNQSNINDALIRLHLFNVRLVDVIDAVAKVADPPIQYSVLDYAVVFRPRGPKPDQLFTRVYKVDPDTFIRGMQKVVAPSIWEPGATDSSIGPGNPDPGVRLEHGQFAKLLRAYFQAAGVEFSTNAVGFGMGGGFGPAGGGTDSGFSSPLPGNALFYNDRTGLLLVRASMEDLDIIEKAIQAANLRPPQVTIEVKFTELSQADAKQAGLEWLLTPDASAPAAGPGNASPPAASMVQLQVTNRNGVISPPALDAKGDFTGDLFDNPGLRNLEQVSPGTAKVISEAQFRVATQALEQKTANDVLAAPRVTTLSGRQTRIAVSGFKEVVSGVSISTDRQNRSKVDYKPIRLQIGPAVDLLPVASTNLKTIALTVTPSWTEFLGYDGPSPFTVEGTFDGDKLSPPVEVQRPLAHFRARRTSVQIEVPDGQTIVITGFGRSPKQVARGSAKSSSAGGRFFQATPKPDEQRQLVVFVTATLIDPAGNRIKTE